MLVICMLVVDVCAVSKRTPRRLAPHFENAAQRMFRYARLPLPPRLTLLPKSYSRLESANHRTGQQNLTDFLKRTGTAAGL